MISLSKLLQGIQGSRATVGCQRWKDFVPPEFIYISEGGPSPPDVDTLKEWLKSYARWRASYEAFATNERALQNSTVAQDEADRRHREFFVALFLQTAQWHAILLMLVKDVSEVDRAKYLGEIDVAAAELKKRIANQ